MNVPITESLIANYHAAAAELPLRESRFVRDKLIVELAGGLEPLWPDEIAEALGCSASTCYRVLRDNYQRWWFSQPHNKGRIIPKRFDGFSPHWVNP